MGMKKGIFIVIDGTDGSGKATQTELLVNKLKEQGREIQVMDFPKYGEPSAWHVEQYLNGNFGKLEEIGPYQASVFYAIDRYVSKEQIIKALALGKIVISNRYVTASMGHQGGKILDPEKRGRFFKWLTHFEFEIMGIPKPDLNIILHMPAHIAQKLVDKKGHRDYVGGAKRDIHESDLNHLQNAEKVYLEIAKDMPNFELIECYQNNKLLTINEVHDILIQIVNKKIK